MVILEFFLFRSLRNYKYLSWFVTLQIVIFGWMLFRIGDIANLSSYDWSVQIGDGILFYVCVFTFFLILMDILNYLLLHTRRIYKEIFIPLGLCLALGGLSIGSSNEEFIYFQF